MKVYRVPSLLPADSRLPVRPTEGATSTKVEAARTLSGTTIAVLGNCQAGPLRTLLSAALPQAEIQPVFTVHLVQEDQHDEVYEQLAKADLILAQRVVDNYPRTYVRTQVLRESFGDKVIVWPNLYYRGYNPELFYLRAAGGGAMQGPLGDYHMRTIHSAWERGASAGVAAESLRDVDANRVAFGDVPEASLRDLDARERDCDVKIAAWVRDQRWSEHLFFTFNHPDLSCLGRTGPACGRTDRADTRPGGFRYGPC